MRHLPLRLIIASLTFLVGVAAASFWFANPPTEQKLRVLIPNDRWVHIFFETPGLSAKSINELTSEANLPSLKTTLLTDNDLEARVWGFDGEEVYGVILKRSAGRWSVTHLYARGTRPVRKYQSLHVPKSGWDRAWERLVGAGILTLPDASEVQCNARVLDGVDYVVEIDADQTYRTYMYDNPQYAKCDAAKRIIKLTEIVDEEFGWKDAHAQE